MPDCTNAESRKKLDQVVEQLRKRNFTAMQVQSSGEARMSVLEQVKGAERVGIGDSATVKQLGLITSIEQMGISVINPFNEMNWQIKDERRIGLLKASLDVDVFLTSVNVLTEDGVILDTDRVGNRICGTIFGPKMTLLVVGRNKIVTDVAAGYKRLKEVTVPAHAQAKGRSTPCAGSGRCYEYENSNRIDRSKDRLCNITVMIEGKPSRSDIRIILVDEDLGLGWDPDWLPNRIEEIHSHYLETIIL